MSKKLSCVLMLSVTFLFILTIICLVIYRVLPAKELRSVYDKLTEEIAEPSMQQYYIDGKMNINTASLTDLIQLPGIGKTLAERIIKFREAYGVFTTIDELLDVDGIGGAKLNAIKDYITVGG